MVPPTLKLLAKLLNPAPPSTPAQAPPASDMSESKP